VKPLVLAGTFAQAQHAALRLGLVAGWHYVNPHMTRGFMNPVVYRVGSWHEREDLEAINAALTPAAPIFIDVPEDL
jgi:hypothetical protein